LFDGVLLEFDQVFFLLDLTAIFIVLTEGLTNRILTARRLHIQVDYSDLTVGLLNIDRRDDDKVEVDQTEFIVDFECLPRVD